MAHGWQTNNCIKTARKSGNSGTLRPHGFGKVHRGTFQNGVSLILVQYELGLPDEVDTIARRLKKPGKAR